MYVHISKCIQIKNLSGFKHDTYWTHFLKAQKIMNKGFFVKLIRAKFTLEGK